MVRIRHPMGWNGISEKTGIRLEHGLNGSSGSKRINSLHKNFNSFKIRFDPLDPFNPRSNSLSLSAFQSFFLILAREFIRIHLKT